MFEAGETSFRRGLRLGLGLVAIAGVAFVLWRAWTVVEALVIATVLSVAIWPWVSRLSQGEGLRLPRPVAVVAILGTTFALIAGLLWLAVTTALPIFDRAATEFPDIAGPIRSLLEPFRSGDVGEGARRVVEDAAAEATGPGGTDAASFLIGSLGGALTFLLVLVFTLFMLIDGDRYAGWMFMLLPRERRADARGLAVRIRDRLSRWVIGWASYGLLAGLAVGLITFALGIPSPWLYGIGALAFALIPGVGTSLVFIPAAFVALGGPPWQLPALAAAAVVYHAADTLFIAPRFLAGALRLPTFVGLVAVLVGVSLFGVWGALIASPLAAAIHETLMEELRPRAATQSAA